MVKSNEDVFMVVNTSKKILRYRSGWQPF